MTNISAKTLFLNVVTSWGLGMTDIWVGFNPVHSLNRIEMIDGCRQLCSTKVSEGLFSFFLCLDGKTFKCSNIFFLLISSPFYIALPGYHGPGHLWRKEVYLTRGSGGWEDVEHEAGIWQGSFSPCHGGKWSGPTGTRMADNWKGLTKRWIALRENTEEWQTKEWSRVVATVSHGLNWQQKLQNQIVICMWNVLHRRLGWDTWFPAGGAVREGYGNFRRKCVTEGGPGDFRVKPHLLFFLGFCLAHAVWWAGRTLLLPCVPTTMDGVLSWTWS